MALHILSELILNVKVLNALFPQHFKIVDIRLNISIKIDENIQYDLMDKIYKRSQDINKVEYRVYIWIIWISIWRYHSFE